MSNGLTTTTPPGIIPPPEFTPAPLPPGSGGGGGTTPPPVPPGPGPGPSPLPPPPPFAQAGQQSFAGYGTMQELGANWRIKFFDADGLPLNMISFDAIDFGAISFKEVFQNVKTILATPMYSAALERLLGVDQTIVDLPVGQSANATVAVMTAIYYWEPRCQPTKILFDTDLISGRLGVALSLSIQPVIFGTNTPYDRNNIFGTPTKVVQGPPQVSGETEPGPPGPAGAQGPRGSLWFQGVGPPSVGSPVVLITARRPVPGPPGPTGPPWRSASYGSMSVQHGVKHDMGESRKHRRSAGPAGSAGLCRLREVGRNAELGQHRHNRDEVFNVHPLYRRDAPGLSKRPAPNAAGRLRRARRKQLSIHLAGSYRLDSQGRLFPHLKTRKTVYGHDRY